MRSTIKRPGGFTYSPHTPDGKPKVTFGLIRRIFGYARPYLWWLLGMLAVTLAVTGLSLLTPLILRELIDRTLPERNLQQLIWFALALLAIPLLNGGLNVLQRQINARVGEGIVYDLRSALFSHLQRMSLSFFTHTKSGELMSRLNNDVVGAQNAISNTLVNIIISLIQAIVVLTVMLTLEWRLTLISVTVLPLFLIAARKLGNRLRDIARLQLDLVSKMNALMNELLNISGSLLVKLFGRTADEDKRFQERAGEVRNIGIRRAVTGTLFFASVGLLSSIGIALVYGIGGFLVIQQEMTIGTIIALGTLLASLYNALQGLTNAPVDFATSMVSFERVFEVLDLPLEIKEKANAHVLKNTRGALEFENVCFQYAADDERMLKDVQRFGQLQDVVTVFSDNILTKDSSADNGSENETIKVITQAREQALEDISFRAEPGQIVALVGQSGAGKTTLTYLIPRLYDPTRGRILIDGYDLKEITLDSLAAQIGMVTQESYMFHDTIRMNLLYARPTATQQEVETAAKAANLHDFIMGLPSQYETIVGERGYRLSGGEKQRLALARVILKNPRILVLDEATSSLDSESEALIQEALQLVMKDRTSIVIAHRLSTILSADLILVMDRGQIIDRGTHTELLAQDGLYARLYNTQFRLKPGNK